MKAGELREMSDGDLQDQLVENKRELFNLRFQLATRQLENFRRLRAVRRDVARILTVMGERQGAASDNGTGDERDDDGA